MKIIDRENIWWEMDAMDIEILDKDVLDLRFIQKGYRIEIMSSHSAIFVRKNINMRKMRKIEFSGILAGE